jgi:hypothetical protein
MIKVSEKDEVEIELWSSPCPSSPHRVAGSGPLGSVKHLPCPCSAVVVLLILS